MRRGFVTEQTHAPDGSKTMSQLAREDQAFHDAQWTITRCAFCPGDETAWGYIGRADDGREAYAAHRAEAHPETLSPNGKPTREAQRRLAEQAAAERRAEMERELEALEEAGLQPQKPGTKPRPLDGAAGPKDRATAAPSSGSSSEAETGRSAEEQSATDDPTVEVAGSTPASRSSNNRGRWSTKAWQPDEIIDAIRRWADDHDGEPPTAIDWRRKLDSYPVTSTVQRVFGSWADAIAAAGFERPGPARGNANGRAGGRKKLAERSTQRARFIRVPGTGLVYKTVDEALVAADEVEHDGERVAENARRHGDDARADEAIDRARELAHKIRRAAEAYEVSTETLPERVARLSSHRVLDRHGIDRALAARGLHQIAVGIQLLADALSLEEPAE